MVLVASFSLKPTGKEPFDTSRCSWDNNESKVGMLSTLLTFILFPIPTIFVVREGAPKVYDRVWDFVSTLCLVHLVLCMGIGGAPDNGIWWVCFLSGGCALFLIGHFATKAYWDRIAQKRLDDK